MDVLIIHAHDTPALPIGVVTKFLRGGNLVYDAHELESKKNMQSRTFSCITLLIEKVCWRYIDR